MTSNTKYYFDFHWPLPVVQYLLDLIFNKDTKASSPTDPSRREWYSQPRLPGSYSVDQRQTVTVFDVGGTNTVGYNGQENPQWGLKGLAPADNLTWRVVPYPATIPFRPSWELGVANLIQMINDTPGKFILVGTSQGATVTSLVYNELRYGSLTARRNDLIGGFTFGNPMREQGHTFPGGYNPGGQGIQNMHLDNTEDLWWDMANPGDIITASPTGDTGQWLAAMIEQLNDNALDLALLSILLGNPPPNLAVLFAVLRDALLSLGNNTHETYDKTRLPGHGQTAAQIVGEQINQLALSQPVSSQTVRATTEVLTITFRLPLSVSEVSFEALRVPCRVELWYQDRSNNWRQMLDPQQLPCAVTISGAESRSWYKADFKVYPVVAKRVQLRISRVPTSQLASVPYVVGIRNTLIRRNVYDRAAGTTSFEDEVDVMGNVVAKYVRDWDPARAYDENPTTFWKSAPQPDPAAVVNLYLDVRQPDGTPRLIDRLYLDPVYMGQQMNLYYSTDDTQSTLKLSPIALTPTETILVTGTASSGSTSTLVDNTKSWVVNAYKDKRVYLTSGNGAGQSFLIAANTADTLSLATTAVTALNNTTGYEIRGPGDENTDWQLTRGRRDIAAANKDAYYRWKINVGPLAVRDAWMGVEWTPAFDGNDAPALDPILLRAIPATSPIPNACWRPALVYDTGGQFQLIFDNGQTQRTYNAPVSNLFRAGDTLRIVAGWAYDPKRVYLSVRNAQGEEIASLDAAASTLPTDISFDNTMEMSNFRGTITNTVVKLENYLAGTAAFLAGPEYYTSPDPVLPDEKGNIPSTTLDNAIYAACWTRQEHGTGGAHDSHYEDKEWSPIWRDYHTEKGMFFFPSAVTAKFLKLELSNLTEEPYPIYEAGVETRYRTYPISVLQQSTIGTRLYTGEGGLLGNNFISLNGVRSVNWLNPTSVMQAVTGILGTQTSPVMVQTGPAIVTATLPNQPYGSLNASESYRMEMSSNLIYRREQLNPYVLAENEYYTTIKAEGLMKIAEYTDVPWTAIQASNVGAIQNFRSAGALPVRGSDWWIFPGQTLRIPAYVMQRLTSTSTVTERKLTTEHRIRFGTTSVHRYDYRTLKRDTAIAYFAGIREVQPFSPTYIDGDDPDFFEFNSYGSQWLNTYTRVLDSGPVTTTVRNYELANSMLDTNIGNWQASSDQWEWSSFGHYGGCAQVTADGDNQELLSTLQSVSPGDQVQVTCRVKWTDMVAADDSIPIRLGAVCYLDGELTNAGLWPTFDSISYADWSAHGDSSGGEDGWLLLDGTWTVPEGVDRFRARLQVTDDADPGAMVYFDTVYFGDDSGNLATLFKRVQTTSTFAQAQLEFRDSGLVRSNAMWAQQDDPDGSEQLAYYVQRTNIPEGTWGDTFRTWGDGVTTWGSPFPLVSITVDGDRRYQGKRVLRMRRAAGAGEAGLTMRQWTNVTPNALVRIGCVFYKPYANDNEITLRLRRGSSGVFLHEEVIAAPSGRWNTYTSQFFEIPGTDHPAEVYTLSMTMSGDDEDEIYLNDLYTEVALIRYYARLGDINSTQHEVTDLRYSSNPVVQVSRTTPVNEMQVTAAILSPKAYAFGCRITPKYLR